MLCTTEKIDRILIALPSASRERLGAIEARALKTDAQVKILANASDTDGAPLLNNLRDLDLTDLLGREHAPVDPGDIADYLEGANVLVTGAGGSIGSEIARQVSRYRPARLLLLDRDDSLLFEAVSNLDKAEPILADIRDEGRLREIFDRHEPDVVFHAAAHKHVPILESHPAEAVQTNILGTWTLAQVAADHRCRLVHISTDKAVDPCSIMGASKRVAELAVLSIGNEHALPFAAVRFGNVLGSRGSVVPTFFRQIVEGGPVTVTDPEMTRYFMTIPEAVSLVLQAGAMADKRKVFELDMGQPVKIIELARQMIRLAGHRPDEDIKIEIVGTRPGERLHEYLHDDAEIVEPTWHPSIRSLTPKIPVDPTRLSYFLDVWRRAAAPAHLTRSWSACSTRCSPSAASSATSTPTSKPDGPAQPAPTHRERALRRRRDSTIDLIESERGIARPAAACPRCSVAARRSRPGLPFARPTRPAARPRDAPPQALLRQGHAHQRPARRGARSPHRRPPRRRARRCVELVHVGPDAARAGGHRRALRPRRGPELHVLRVCARGGVERPRPPLRRVPARLLPDRHRAGRGCARGRERDPRHAHLRSTVRPALPARGDRTRKHGHPGLVFDAAHALARRVRSGRRSARSASPRSSA